MSRIDLASYRVLVIFQALLRQPQSLQDLNMLCYSDQYLNREYSDAQLMRDISCLRQWGCIIPKASRRYQGKYILLEHPLTLHLAPAQQTALLAVAHQQAVVANLLSQASALLPEKLRAELIEVAIEVIQDYPPSPAPDPELLKKLAAVIDCKGIIRFTYTRNQFRSHLAQPLRIEQEEGRFYLWAFMPEWILPKATRFLLEYIADVQTNIKDASVQARMQSTEAKKEVVYRLWPPLATKYRPRTQETLTPDPDYPDAMRVMVITRDLFPLKQRLLKYGACCEVLQPAHFRKALQQEVLQMSERYKMSEVLEPSVITQQ